MRSTIIAAVCLVTLGLFTAAAPAETFVVPVPELATQYGDPYWEGPIDVVYLLMCISAGSVDFGAQFQSIQEIRLHLAGTASLTDPCNNGCWFGAQLNNGLTASTATYNGPFETTVSFGVSPVANYSALLSGQSTVSLALLWHTACIDPPFSVTSTDSLPLGTITAAHLEIIGTHVPGTLKGDFNGDESVDVVDLLTFIDTFGLSLGDPGYNPACDLSGDNSVDVADLLTFVGFFGNPQ